MTNNQVLYIVFGSLCAVGAIGCTYSLVKCINVWTPQSVNLLRRGGDIELADIQLIDNDINWSDIIHYPPSAHLDTAINSSMITNYIRSPLEHGDLLSIIDVILQYVYSFDTVIYYITSLNSQLLLFLL